MPRTRCVPAMLAMLAFAWPFSSHAQWVPGGVKLASSVSSLVSAPPAPVPDGRGGAVFAADELAKPEAPRGSAARIDADGTVPAGWPSPAVPASLLSFGTASDAAGGAFVGRLSSDAVPSLVVFHVLASGGLDPAWPSAGRVVADSAAGFHGMQLIADGSGGLFAISDVTITDELGMYDGRLRALRLQSDGSLAPGWPEGGVLLARAPFIPRQGRAFVTGAGVILQGEWESNGPVPYPGGPRTPYVVGFSPAGARLPGWASYAMPVPLSAQDDAVQLVTDGSGGAFYALTRANALRTTVHHLRANGTLDPVWPAGGFALVSDTSAFAPIAGLAFDGNSGCFGFGVVLDGPAPGSEHSSVIHLLGSGASAPGWPVALPAFWNPGGESPAGRLALVPDGDGGVFLHQLEQRVPSVFSVEFRRLRIQHLTPSGNVAAYWPAAGRLFAEEPGARMHLSAIPDGHRGVIVSWLDSRADTTAFGGGDLYALGLGPDGSFTTSVGPALATRTRLNVSPVPTLGATQISFALASRANVSLAVFDVGGRRVRQLHEGALDAGQHSIRWDGQDAAGRAVPPGVYLARASMNGTTSDARIVRLR